LFPEKTSNGREVERCSTDPVRLSDRLNGPAEETREIEYGTRRMSDEKEAGEDHCG
jgi:hypothetical protein